MTRPSVQVVRTLLETDGPKAVHDAYCSGSGQFRVQDGSYEQIFRCPYCQYLIEHASKERQAEADVRSSGVGPRYWQVGWDDLELVDPLPALREASTHIGDFTRSGRNLILCGSPGTGKTQAAVLLVRAAIEAGHTAAFANIGRVGMAIRAGYDQEGGVTEADEVERLESVDLLVLDDIGVGEAGDAKIERRLLYFIADSRHNARKPTIITSNLTAQEVRDFVGDRVMNRLMPVDILVFEGKNFRLANDSGPTWTSR